MIVVGGAGVSGRGLGFDVGNGGHGDDDDDDGGGERPFVGPLPRYELRFYVPFWGLTLHTRFQDLGLPILPQSLLSTCRG